MSEAAENAPPALTIREPWDGSASPREGAAWVSSAPAAARAPLPVVDRPPIGRPLAAFYGMLSLVAVGYLASLFARRNGVDWTWLDGWGVASFELIVSALVLARARRDPRDLGFAVVLGIGMCFWAIGDFALTVETLGDKTPPDVSTANVLWAGFYPFVYVAVMMLIRQEARKLRLANYLDGVMAALAAVALFAAFAYRPIADAAGGSTASVVVNLIYPAGDIFLFALVVVALVLLPTGRKTRWYLIGVACIVNMAGDVSALFPGVLATRFGFVSDAAAWPISLLLLSLATWLGTSSPERELEETKPSFLLSSLAAGSALLVVMVASVRGTDGAALAFATLALATAGIRFGLTLRQLSRLTDDRLLQLEQAARTEQNSHRQLQTAVRELEAVARAEQESRAALQAAMRDYSDFSAKAAEGASRQSAALVTTSATVDQVRVAVSTTAQRAVEVAERAQESLQVSDQGVHAVATIAQAMAEIRERVQDIARDIAALSARTRQIGDITDTVKQLADRSKLLALNASIEAARAGERGKGFGVVAAEVRNLSDQSREATTQVEKALAEIRDATEAAVNASEKGTKVVDDGLKLAGQAGAVIQSLTDTIREASQAVADIAASAQQERAGIDEIATSMRDVNAAADHLNELYRGLRSPESNTALLAGV